jgi:hypothetical protein
MAVELIVQWAPLVVLLAVWLFFMRRMSIAQVAYQRSLDHMDKAETHMQRLESKLDRLVFLLENFQSARGQTK